MTVISQCIDTPLGQAILVVDADRVVAFYFAGQRPPSDPEPVVATTPTLRFWKKRNGKSASTSGKKTSLQPSDRSEGNGFSAARMGYPEDGSLRGNTVVPGDCVSRRRRQEPRPGGRFGDRAQPRHDPHPLPPDHRIRRLPDRIRGRAGPEEGVIGPGRKYKDSGRVALFRRFTLGLLPRTKDGGHFSGPHLTGPCIYSGAWVIHLQLFLKIS